LVWNENLRVIRWASPDITSNAVAVFGILLNARSINQLYPPVI